MFENVRHYAKTDIGLVRQNNEDNYFVYDQLPEPCNLERLGMLFVIADGMGGHAAGEIASKMACEEAVAAYYKEDFIAPDNAHDSIWQIEKLEKAFWTTHKKIINAATEKEELRGMGTTLSALLLSGNQAIIAHVGDSRIYRLRNNVCERLTIDHTKNQLLLDVGKIQSDHEKNHCYGNIITQALGGYDDLTEVFIRVDTVRRGDLFLLSTDGLHDLVTDSEIQEILEMPSSLQALCDELVQAAIGSGGRDNITVIVVKI